MSVKSQWIAGASTLFHVVSMTPVILCDHQIPRKWFFGENADLRPIGEPPGRAGFRLGRLSSHLRPPRYISDHRVDIDPVPGPSISFGSFPAIAIPPRCHDDADEHDRRQTHSFSQGPVGRLAGVLDARVSVRLWDGSIVPLGRNADPNLFVSVSGPGVIGALLRRPTVENIVGHYARGQLDFHGTDLMTFIETLRVKNSRQRTRQISKLAVARDLWPFLFVPAEKAEVDPTLAAGGDEQQQPGEDNRALIQFHYDVGNDFYRLFLDERMVYTCAYFTDWNNSLEQAQFDKLDMVCRKLQLKPGDRLLDMGCGWGALVCHAAEHYGVEAHGVTLSQAQVDFAQERIRTEGLEGRARVELKDYNDVVGQYDKVCAIGMIEHIGLANIPNYLGKVNSLLPDRGIFLNHGITRPAKRSKKLFKRIRPEQRLLRKYIFPGGELDHIGHTVDMMEAHASVSTTSRVGATTTR